MDYDDSTPFASFGQRFLAYLLDIIILMVVLGILFSVFGISMFSGFDLTSGETLTEEETMEMASKALSSMLYANFLSTALTILYFSYFESSEKQATLGKQALGLVVTDLEGGRISFGKAILRNIGRIISGLILFIGYIMAAFTDKKQALHDLIANTVVLKP